MIGAKCGDFLLLIIMINVGFTCRWGDEFYRLPSCNSIGSCVNWPRNAYRKQSQIFCSHFWKIKACKLDVHLHFPTAQITKLYFQWFRKLWHLGHNSVVSLSFALWPQKRHNNDKTHCDRFVSLGCRSRVVRLYDRKNQMNLIFSRELSNRFELNLARLFYVSI